MIMERESVDEGDAMNCQRCTTIPKTELKNVKVYLQIPTKHHLEPVKNLLENNSLHFQGFDEGFIIQVPDFQRFVDMIEKQGFYDLEKRDIMLLPLLEGESLSLSTLKRHKSMKEWINLYNGKALLDVLENRRLKIMFHPIINPASNEIYGYEALTRGLDEQGEVIPPVALFQMAKDLDLLFYLDRLCRETIIQRASEAGITKKLFINFIPTSIYDPEKCLKSTDEAIMKHGLNPEQIVFEVVETERVNDFDHLNYILDYYKRKGYSTALDDIGSGYSSTSSLLALNPDYMKIDMALVRNIHNDPEKQLILQEYVNVARIKNIRVLAEGIEQVEELTYLNTLNIDLMQGYYFAKPSTTPLLTLEEKWEV